MPIKKNKYIRTLYNIRNNKRIINFIFIKYSRIFYDYIIANLVTYQNIIKD